MARILVVDDSTTDAVSIRKMLEKHGHDVAEARSAAEALEAVAQTPPDVVVMDVVMPGMNGFQATRNLSKNPATAHIPVVVVSAKGQETDKLWARRQGAQGYVVKPVREADLMGSINLALSGNGQSD